LGDKSVLRIGFLGRLVAQKNLGYLLEVFQVLTRMLQPEYRCELHLFGDGDERSALERESAKMNLSGVYFHGEVARADVGQAIDSCDFFLNTSTTEGQCLAALEVLARGRPMVVTPVGALPDVLREAELGALAPLGDAPTFAKVVASTARDLSAGRYTPESVAAVFRAKYDYESIRQRYLDLLADVITD
jgi:glycosyltransferase involved in cell wall biosynthesis